MRFIVTVITIVIFDPSLVGIALKRRSEKVMVLLACEHSAVKSNHRPRIGLRCILLCALTVLVTLAIAGPSDGLLAQDDPFAVGSTLNATPSLFTDGDKGLSTTQKLIRDSIVESNPVTPVELVNSGQAMFDAGLFQDVRFILGQLQQRSLEDKEWLEVVDQTGSTFFLSVFSDMETQPEGRVLATKVLSAARRASETSGRLQELIKTLSSEDNSAKRLARIKLQALGEPAIAEMINVFANPDRSDEYDDVRMTINMLARGLHAPLVGAARSTNANVRFESIRALARIESDASSDVLMWSYLSPSQPPEIQQLSLAALQERGVPANPRQIEQRFFTRAFKYLTGELKPSMPFNGQVSIWNWNQDENRLKLSNVDAELATRLTAARHAASLYEINPSSKRNRAVFLLTQLESFQRVAGPGLTIDANGVVDRLNTSASEIDVILSQAVRLKLYPAATACCEILKKSADQSFLNRPNGEPSSLIAAITSGDRFLQYAAFDAITSIDPKIAYVGSSFVLNYGVLVAQSEQQPLALVGHPNVNIARSYAATIGDLGVKGIAANRSKELFEVATTNPDVEMIFICDTLGRPGHLNLIRQLRSDWRTRRLPIALLYTDIDRGQLASKYFEDDELFVAMPLTLSPQQISTHVGRLVSRAKPYRLSTVDRQRQGSAAIQWLAKISKTREQYRFYDLADHQDALNGLLFQPGQEVPVSSILAGIGLPSAQLQLVDFASQNSLPIEKREAAAQAFAQSVNQGGTLLTTGQIKRQYDRYNASAKEPKATQEVLGSILDAIESKRQR